VNEWHKDDAPAGPLYSDEHRERAEAAYGPNAPPPNIPPDKKPYIG